MRGKEHVKARVRVEAEGEKGERGSDRLNTI